MIKFIILSIMFALVCSAQGQVHYCRGAYTNFSDIIASFDGKLPVAILLLIAW